MFTGFTNETIDFMWELRLNNEKTWFEANKERFIKDFQTPMKALAQAVYESVAAANSKQSFSYRVSRIYRDARRVRGGEPYRCNMWFTIERATEEWTATPVFWFELTPETWRYGLGYYQAKPMTMAKFRARIDKDTAGFKKLIAPLKKQDEFILEGDEYKRIKAAPSPETQDWYNKKSLVLVHQQDNGEELFSENLVDRLVSGYKFLMPYYDYFITLDSDPDTDSN